MTQSLQSSRKQGSMMDTSRSTSMKYIIPKATSAARQKSYISPWGEVDARDKSEVKEFLKELPISIVLVFSKIFSCLEKLPNGAITLDEFMSFHHSFVVLRFAKLNYPAPSDDYQGQLKNSLKLTPITKETGASFEEFIVSNAQFFESVSDNEEYGIMIIFEYLRQLWKVLDKPRNGMMKRPAITGMASFSSICKANKIRMGRKKVDKPKPNPIQNNNNYQNNNSNNNLIMGDDDDDDDDDDGIIENISAEGVGGKGQAPSPASAEPGGDGEGREKKNKKTTKTAARKVKGAAKGKGEGEGANEKKIKKKKKSASTESLSKNNNNNNNEKKEKESSADAKKLNVQIDPANDIPFFISNGMTLTKHSRSGKPKPMFVIGTLDHIFWGKNQKSAEKEKKSGSKSQRCIAWYEINEVRKGKTSMVFERDVSRNSPSDHCFTIETDERTLDLETEDMNTRDIWVQHLEAIIADYE